MSIIPIDEGVWLFKCNECAHEWKPYKNIISKNCPKCHTVLWDRDRKKWTTHNPRSPRSSKIIELRKNNPCISGKDIAMQVGVSRQRVHQILKRANLPNRATIMHQLYSCLNCGKSTTHKRYCSRECQYVYTHPLVECHQCGNFFRREKTWLLKNNSHFYCSKQCQGKHLADTAGFGAHPENQRLSRIGKQKYSRDILEVINQRSEMGEALTFIAKELNIPRGSIYWLRARYRKESCLPIGG